MTGLTERRSSARIAGRLVTTASIAIVAYAAMDMCHEVLGHGVATLFFDNVTPTQLTTVALSSTGATSRLVALAGPLMNLLLGVLAMAWFRCFAKVGKGSFFLWLFATINLLNGTGYPMYSGILDFGDMAVVIAGWQSHIAWRIGMAILGAAGYYVSLRVASASLTRWLDLGGVARGAIPLLTWPSYIAGGSLLVAGAAMNPIPNLILLVGASGGFGCMLGLLFVPSLVEPGGGASSAGGEPWGFSRPWIVGAVIVAATFVFVIGPGVALHA